MLKNVSKNELKKRTPYFILSKLSNSKNPVFLQKKEKMLETFLN
jgi:hypothetical protein